MSIEILELRRHLFFLQFFSKYLQHVPNTIFAELKENCIQSLKLEMVAYFLTRTTECFSVDNVPKKKVTFILPLIHFKHDFTIPNILSGHSYFTNACCRHREKIFFASCVYC